MSGKSTLTTSMIFAILLIVPNACGSEKISFKFGPPDGTRYTQTMMAAKTISYQTGQTQTDSTRAEVSVEVNKAEFGFKMTVTPIVMKMYRDNQAIENPILPLLNNMIINYDIDQSGQLRSLEGYDEFIEDAKTSLPPAIVANLESVINKDVMIANEVDEWNGRVGRFAGKAIEIGEQWVDTIKFQLPTGEVIDYYTVTTFDEFVDCNGSICLKISFNYNSEPTKFESLLSKNSGNQSLLDSLAAMEVQLPDLYGEGYRIVDPATLLVYDEESNRTMRMMVVRQGAQPMMVTVYEEKKYYYAY